MTHQQNSSDPWVVPYGTPPAGGGQPQSPQWHSPGSASTSMPLAPPYSYPAAGDMPLAWTGSLQPQGDPRSLDQPWYGIGIVDAVARAYRKTFRFDGRASRGEYWWFALYLTVLWIALGAVTSIIATVSASAPGAIGGLFGLAMLVHIPVGLSLTVRRLHDSGTSGWFCLLSLIPYLGALIVAGLCCLKPTASGDRYNVGPRPISGW